MLRQLPLFIFLLFFTGMSELYAQITIKSLDSEQNIKNAIINTLQGDGVEISNVIIKHISNVVQVAEFGGGIDASAKKDIGIDSGIVISTGDTRTLDDTTKEQRGKEWKSRTSDNDLTALLNKKIGTRKFSALGVQGPERQDILTSPNSRTKMGTNTPLDSDEFKCGKGNQCDPIIITFDIKPTANNLTIDFVFGSDEYEEFVDHKEYPDAIDAYGFFIKGHEIAGEYEGGAINAAELPNGDPVSTNYVNRKRNDDYYIRNPDVDFNKDWEAGKFRGNHVALNGWTKVMNGYLPVKAGEIYNVKIALGEGRDAKYDSSVFIGKFKSQRVFAGRVFHHTKGLVNDKLLAEGDQSFTYFPNTRVVLFDSDGNYVTSTLTGSRGGYQFSVHDNESYQIAIDASTLTPGDHDSDDKDLYPEQTWTGPGGLCADGQGGTGEGESGYCYGGRTESRDRLRKYPHAGCAAKGNSPNNQPPKECFNLSEAEHIIRVPAGVGSHTNLNVGFSYDVVTHTKALGQGSLLNFMHANNGDNYSGQYYGTGEMLFVPIVTKNNGQGWKITVDEALPALKRPGAIIDGRTYNFLNPESYSHCEPLETTSLTMTTSRNEPLLRLVGANQSVCNMELTGSNVLRRELIDLSNQSSSASITNNFFNDNFAQGVAVRSQGNRISRNRFRNTFINSVSLPIDLKGDAIINENTGGYSGNANNGIDRPIITSITSSNETFIIEGFALAGVTLEFYRMQGNDYRYSFQRTEGQSGQDEDSGKGSYKDPYGNKEFQKQPRFKFTIPVNEVGAQSGDSLVAIAIDSAGNTSEFSNEIKMAVPQADVTLTPEYNKSTAPGLFVHFPHTLISGGDGTVTLSVQWLSDDGHIKSRTTGNWPIKLEKTVCKIEQKQSTASSTSTLELQLKPEEPVCFQASLFVPAETPQGVRGSLKITASAEEDGEIIELAHVIDQFTVSDGGSGRLKLQKWVRKKTEKEQNSTTNTAGSGEALIYTIQFENIGSGPLTSLKLMDNTPAFTSLSEPVNCHKNGSFPESLGVCRVETLGALNDKGFKGRIIWHFDGDDGAGGADGVLLPGAGGEVSYELMVE